MFAGHRPTFYHCAAQPIYNIASTEITEETLKLLKLQVCTPSLLKNFTTTTKFQASVVLPETSVHPVITTSRYDSAVYAVIMCPSVCLSHAGIVPKWLNIGLTLHDSQGL